MKPKKWSIEEINLLEKLISENKSVYQISKHKEMNRTPQGIIKKLYNEGYEHHSEWRKR